MDLKKWMIIAVLSVFLTGCGAQETFETVADDVAAPAAAQMRQTIVELPKEAASPTVESESGRIYLCDGYEISLQTLLGGDLQSTIRAVSGYDPGELTVMHTQNGDLDRYEFVWASAGEGGDRIGRAAVLDDGSYHYVLTVLGDAETAWSQQDEWIRMFQSFCVS